MRRKINGSPESAWGLVPIRWSGKAFLMSWVWAEAWGRSQGRAYKRTRPKPELPENLHENLHDGAPRPWRPQQASQRWSLGSQPREPVSAQEEGSAGEGRGGAAGLPQVMEGYSAWKIKWRPGQREGQWEGLLPKIQGTEDRSYLQTHIAFTHHVPLVSFNLEWFLSLFCLSCPWQS